MPDKDEKIVVTIDEDLEDLIPEYLATRREDIKSIQEALDKEDYDKIRILGHSMKGSGGGYGFDRISEIGGVIEDEAEGKNSEEIKKQNENLVSYLDRVEVVFE